MSITAKRCADQARPHDDARKEAQRREIRERYKRRKKHEQPISVYRIGDLGRLFNARYGGEMLPDDDSGRDDLELVAHHLVDRPGDLLRHLLAYASLRAPWFTRSEAEALASKVLANPIERGADTLAWRLGLTDAERSRLGVTTIGSIDVNAAQRKERRKQKDKERKAAKRRAAGAKPHSESDRRTKPWLLVGMTQRTWERRGKPRSAPDVAKIRPQHIRLYIGVDELPPTQTSTTKKTSRRPRSGSLPNTPPPAIKLLPIPLESASHGNPCDDDEVLKGKNPPIELQHAPEPPPQGWLQCRDPRNGERYEMVGTPAWVMPEFQSHAPRGIARDGDFDGYAFHLSVRQVANLAKQFPDLTGEALMIALMICDAWYLENPPPKDGRMLFRIKAWLKRDAERHRTRRRKESHWSEWW